MPKTSFKNIVILVSSVSAVSLVISIPYFFFNKSNAVKNTALEKQQATDSSRPALADNATPSSKPANLVIVSRKTAQGVLKSLDKNTLTISNAYEDVSFNLGEISTARLTLIKERTEATQVPEMPEIKDIKLSDLKTSDQLTLLLEDRGSGQTIIEIQASRKK